MHIESFVYKSVKTTINYTYTFADTTSYSLFYDWNQSSYCAYLHNNSTTAYGQQNKVLISLMFRTK